MTVHTPARLLVLAPMEGVLDHSLRDVLSSVGGVDRCVSEFIRITDQLLPPRVFTRLMPELLRASRTPGGVSVRAQLLGSDPVCLAENAARLAALGAEGIDLNFGCPAKTVNRHRGGAVLLDEPELLHRIVNAVRRAVPRELPVSAKMRLGNADTSKMLDAAQAIAAGGACEVVVHGRTKRQGYKPPADWAAIGRIRERLDIPVIANGEIWTVGDAERCLAESGCQALMLGRGLVANPGLALLLRGAAPMPWSAVLPLLRRYAQHIAPRVAPRHRGGRLKQWLHLLRRHFAEAQAAYDSVRTLADAEQIERCLFGPAPAASPYAHAA